MFTESSLQKLLSIMNSHLPIRRRYFKELMAEADPRYECKDGHSVRIDRKELQLIATILDEQELGRLRLPVILMSDTSTETGTWKASGKAEAKLLGKVIGKEPETEDEIRLYFPHLNELRRKLPTATTVMFVP